MENAAFFFPNNFDEFGCHYQLKKYQCCKFNNNNLQFNNNKFALDALEIFLGKIWVRYPQQSLSS